MSEHEHPVRGKNDTAKACNPVCSRRCSKDRAVHSYRTYRIFWGRGAEGEASSGTMSVFCQWMGVMAPNMHQIPPTATGVIYVTHDLFLKTQTHTHRDAHTHTQMHTPDQKWLFYPCCQVGTISKDFQVPRSTLTTWPGQTRA